MEEDNLATPKGHVDASNAEARNISSPDPNSVDLSAVPKSGVMHDDISQILKGIKLPERYAFTAQGDSKAPIEEKEAPVETPKPVPVIKAPQTSETMSAVVPLRTLKNDLQDVVRDNKMSLVKVVALEQDKRRKGSIDTNVAQSVGRRKRTFGTLFVIFLFFGLGAAALLGVYYVVQQGKTPAQTQQSSATTILFAETTVGLSINNLTPDSLKQQLSAARDSSSGAVGSIMRIVPIVSTSTNGTTNQTPVALGDFLNAMGAQAPDDLIRSLSPDFFFGIHTVDKNAPVFVIPVISYDHAFAGMLEWEKTMDTDLSPVFAQVPVLKSDANGLPVTRTFEDAVMNNYDVRALKDDSGTIQLYYSFPRPNILVIAQSPYTFGEVLSRLQSARKL